MVACPLRTQRQTTFLYRQKTTSFCTPIVPGWPSATKLLTNQYPENKFGHPLELGLVRRSELNPCALQKLEKLFHFLTKLARDATGKLSILQEYLLKGLLSATGRDSMSNLRTTRTLSLFHFQAFWNVLTHKITAAKISFC